MKIAVLGGGNGSFAAAGDLALGGHEIRLWRRDARAVDAHRAHGGIIGVTDFQGKREARIASITTDIAEAMAGAELILCPAPAFAQADIAAAVAPHLKDDQVVFLPPGTFGSVIFARAAHDAGNKARAAFAETGTLPWLARKQGPFEVRISGRGKRLPTGVLPLHRAQHALDVIGKAFPGVIEPCGDALSGALMNAGPVIHPPLMVMNAAPLQHFERWDIHNEGTQPAVRAVTDRLDQERIRVREALGYGAPHYPLADHYLNDRWMYGDAHKKLVKSGDWREHIDLHHHRYVTEDTVLGLAFLASVARWAGADAPIAEGLLAVTGGFLGRDLRRGPRTLEAMGLASMTREAMQWLLHEGE
jgi:opine dehydrogenase